MNLLSYTKKLYEKINFYDKQIKENNFDKTNPNPFFVKEPLHLTIIWIDDK